MEFSREKYRSSPSSRRIRLITLISVIVVLGIFSVGMLLMATDVHDLRRRSQIQDMTLRLLATEIHSNHAKLENMSDYSTMQFQGNNSRDLVRYPQKDQWKDELTKKIEELSKKPENMSDYSPVQFQGSKSEKLDQDLVEYSQEDQRIDELAKQVDELSKKVDGPVRLFDKCRLDKDECSVGSKGNGRYWKACSTEFLPVEVEVSAVTLCN